MFRFVTFIQKCNALETHQISKRLLRCQMITISKSINAIYHISNTILKLFVHDSLFKVFYFANVHIPHCISKYKDLQIGTFK